MKPIKNSQRCCGFVRHFIRYAAVIVVIPHALMVAYSFFAGQVEILGSLSLPITIYCAPAAFCFGRTGGGHFFMHAEVFPGDFIGWAAVFLFWSAISAAVGFVRHWVIR